MYIRYGVQLEAYPQKKGDYMTEQEYKDIIVYLQARVEELENQKLCGCDD